MTAASATVILAQSESLGETHAGSVPVNAAAHNINVVSNDRNVEIIKIILTLLLLVNYQYTAIYLPVRRHHCPIIPIIVMSICLLLDYVTITIQHQIKTESSQESQEGQGAS